MRTTGSWHRHHYDSFFNATDDRATGVRRRTLELSEFLVNVLQIKSLPGRFDGQVGIHESCHGLRELRLSCSSETRIARPDLLRSLLELLEGIHFSSLQRSDECCGFGGTFAVAEEAVSCMMGEDRIRDHLESGTEVLTAGDMSCLMHLEGIIRRRHHPLRVMHFAEIIASALQSAPDTASPTEHPAAASGEAH